MVKNMDIHFTINASPFSINKAYYKRSFTRTEQCRAWGDSVLAQLQAERIQADFEALRACCETRHGLEAHLTFHIPAKLFYTKKGEISRRSQDLSNVEKMLIDLIFDERYCGRELDDGQVINNLSLDDKLIVKLVSEKKPTEGSAQIEVTLRSLHPPEK